MNDRTSLQKKIYIVYMCDHLYALAAAMEAHGLSATVLPPTDHRSLEIGLEICRGRECLPCLYTIGDIIHKIREPDFDPGRSVFLMPSGQGPCRFGQYLPFQKEKIIQLGYQGIEFAAPSGENSYQGFGDNPMALRLLVWEGIVAVDLLQKLLHEYRPYEINQGETDAIYQICLLMVIKAVRSGDLKSILSAMEEVAAHFDSLPVKRNRERPIIGIVGEIYLRVNPHVNQDIVLQVEALGGEVYLATVLEWLYFTNWCFQTFSWEIGHYWESIKMRLTDFQQSRLESKLSEPVAHLLRNPKETPVQNVLEKLRPTIDPMLGLEAVFTLGKGMDMAEIGVSGILNLIPFNCMSGIISSGLAPNIRSKLDNIPWLDVTYDGQETTNINTRLEAFMVQASQYQRSNSKVR